MLQLLVCMLLSSGEARPTVAITPPVPESSPADSWLGMALGDHLTNRLLIHSRFEPKDLSRVYPLNVFGWRQALSAARSEGLELTGTPGKTVARLGNQLGADYVFVATYTLDNKAVTIKWSLDAARGKGKSGVLRADVDTLSQAAESLSAEILTAIGQKPQTVGGHKLEPLPLAAVKPFGQGLEILAAQSLDPRAHLVLSPGQLQQALATLASSTDAAPSFARAWVERGFASTMLGDFKGAEEAFVQAMAQAGEFEPPTALGLYYLYDRQGKTNDAIKVLEEATSTHLGFLQGLGYLGEAYARGNRVHEALQLFTTYSTRVPQSPWAQVKRAAALSRVGKHDLAIAETQEVLKKHPDSVMVLSALASRQIDAGRFEDAVRSIKAGLELHPDHPVLLTRLSYVKLQQNQVNEALILAEKAVAALGEGRGEQLAGYAHMNLGHALAILGRRSDAIAAIKKAQELGVGADELGSLTRDGRLKDFLNSPGCPVKIEIARP